MQRLPIRWARPGRIIGLTVLLVSLGGTATAQAPATDIAIVSVHRIDGEPAVGGFHRVTDRERYDNQPSFLDEDTLVYTAMAEDEDSTDIWIYDVESRRAEPLVTTPESEYSATLVPADVTGIGAVSRPAISVIRDYGDLRQELWAYAIGRRPAEPVWAITGGVESPIGYHAWVDERLIVFVLGEPPTLQLAVGDRDPQAVLADNPGRALAKTGENRVSFVHKISDAEWWLTEIELEPAEIAVEPRGRSLLSSKVLETRRLIRMPSGSEDYAWAPDGTVWSAKGGRLMVAGPFDGSGGASTRWRPVGDVTSTGLGGLGVGTISRLAFSPSGDRLAIVFERR